MNKLQQQSTTVIKNEVITVNDKKKLRDNVAAWGILAKHNLQENPEFDGEETTPSLSPGD